MMMMMELKISKSKSLNNTKLVVQSLKILKLYKSIFLVLPGSGYLFKNRLRRKTKVLKNEVLILQRLKG